MDRTESQLMQFAIAIQANIPTILWGSPGEAKSALISKVFEKLDWPYQIILGSIMDPTDVGGWPIDAGDHGIVRRAPQWAMQLSKEKLGDKPGGLFLEELNLAPKAVQAAMMRVVHDRVVGDLELGVNVARVAAANPIEESAGGWLFDPPMANRFFHMKWSLTFEYWQQAAMTGFPLPSVIKLNPKWREVNLPQQKAMCLAYLNAHRTAFKDIPKSDNDRSGPFPTPRSWTLGWTLLGAAASIGAPEEIQVELLGGCVGQHHALQFNEWRSKLNLPDPEQVLAKPNKVTWPQRGDKVYAILTSVAAAILGNNTPERWERGWQVWAAAADTHKDIAAAVAKSMVPSRPKGSKIPKEAEVFYEAMAKAGLVPTR